MGMLDGYKKTIVAIEKEVKVKSTFDYSEFSEKEKETLIELEHQAVHYGEEIRESIKELGKVFEEAQEKFASHKGGVFVAWFENLGFKKDFVYLCLGRKSLSEKYGAEIVYKLPDREVQFLAKLDKKEEDDKIIKVLESENPREELKVIIQEEKENKRYRDTIEPSKRLFHDVDKTNEIYNAEVKEVNNTTTLKFETEDDNKKQNKIKKFLGRMVELEAKLRERTILSSDEEEKINSLLNEIEKVIVNKK